MRFLLYKINEVFETIQGEASFTGTPSIFLRLQGCPVGCSWCDTKQTWDVDNVYKVSLDDTVEKKADSDHWAELLQDYSRLRAQMKARMEELSIFYDENIEDEKI